MSATTAQNSAADQEDQKLLLKIKKVLFVEVINKHVIYKFCFQTKIPSNTY